MLDSAAERRKRNKDQLENIMPDNEWAELNSYQKLQNLRLEQMRKEKEEQERTKFKTNLDLQVVEGKQKKQKVVEAKKQVDQEIIQQDTNHK